MKVRVAHAVGLELVELDVEAASLGRIAYQNGCVGGGLIGRITPFELVGGLEGDRGGIELDSVRGCGKTKGEHHCGGAEHEASCHHFLPEFTQPGDTGIVKHRIGAAASVEGR